MSPATETIKAAATKLQPEAVEFFKEIIRIPSLSGQEGPVIKVISEQMKAVGFDEVRIDPFGNVMGRIGSGSRVMAFDAHVDTVDVGDLKSWKSDPYAAETRDGVIYGRGASDQKGGMAALVYAGALIKQLAIEGDMTVWMVGSVCEEDCDGLCWHYILKEKVLAPELVILTEPTNLNLYRGQRGRMEIQVVAPGVSCHGSAPERGINAIHRIAPVINEVDQLNKKLAFDPFLGAGTITSSEIRSTSPSLCAVADSCSLHLDRRLTAGEDDNTAIAEIKAICESVDNAQSDTVKRIGNIEVKVPTYEKPSYTGLVYPMRQYFPAWALSETHEFTKMGLAARKLALGEAGVSGKWTFSTNGVSTMGLHNVPTLGFGPGNEVHAHSLTDQCPVDHIGAAIAFYTAFVSLFAQGK